MGGITKPVASPATFLNGTSKGETGSTVPDQPTLVQTEQSKEDSDSTPDEDDDDSEIFRQRTRKRSIKFFSGEWVDELSLMSR